MRLLRSLAFATLLGFTACAQSGSSASPTPSPLPTAGGPGGICAYRSGMQCWAAGYFCDMPEGQCLMSGATGICQAAGPVCTAQYDPVCGCDDHTYGNACEANAAGTAVAHRGIC